ncbi:MAG: alkaline phosphatase D family protein [Bdellovibrionales bacterium]
MERRQFLALLAGLGMSAHARTSLGSGTVEPESWLFEQSQKIGFSIVQGMTDEVSAQFSLVLPKRVSWGIEVLDEQGRHPRDLQQNLTIVERPHSDQAVYKLELRGLELGREYRLRVNDDQGILRDERDFRALDLSSRSVRLAFASCANDSLHRDDIWHRFEQCDPDMVFFLGDNVYADNTSLITRSPADEEQLWLRYVETRNRIAFYFQRRLKPVLAIWDDHDFGFDNRGRQFQYKEASKFVFDTFWAQSERASLVHGPGIAKRFSAFGADFFLMDGRSFRDSAGFSGRRMFGSAQEEWLFQNVHPRASFLLNGSVFYGAYTGKDSFEGQFGRDFSDFIAKLANTDGLFCFGAGDVHFSEVMDIEPAQLGYRTFEMVSSSIHSFSIPGHEWRFGRNPRRRQSNSRHNFTVFEGEFGEDRIQGNIASYSADGEEFRVGIDVRR